MSNYDEIKEIVDYVRKKQRAKFWWAKISFVVAALLLPLLYVTAFGANGDDSHVFEQENRKVSALCLSSVALMRDIAEAPQRHQSTAYVPDVSISYIVTRESIIEPVFVINDEPADEEPTEPGKIAYITIDDGPSRAITPGILDVLAQEGIKATFFVLPHRNVEDIYLRIIEEGHEIGNHSFSHVYSRIYSAGNIDAFREDVMNAQAYMLDNYGYLTTSFRFPGGSMSRGSSIIAPRRAILEELGYRDFDWHVDSGDARIGNNDRRAVSLTNNVLRNTRNREQLIVLMHDTWDKRTTLEALPMIIEGLREQGYTFDILRNY